MLSIFFNKRNRRNNRFKPGTREYFWQWFLSQVNQFEQHLRSRNEDITVSHALNKKLKEFNELLVGELSVVQGGNCRLIISPDGHIEGVDEVLKLVSTAPAIPGWEIIAFKPPVAQDQLEFRLGDSGYPVSSVLLEPSGPIDGQYMDLKIFIRDMEQNEEKAQQLAFLYLNRAIGEYNTLKRVRYIEFLTLSENSLNHNGMMSFDKLNTWIKKNFNHEM